MKWILLLTSVLLLTSCATTQPPAQNQPISWENRAITLAQLQNWDLKGAIAIRTNRDAFSASWQWQQQQKNYTISLFGPLGANAIQLTGSQSAVALQTSDGKMFHSTSPEMLLKQQLGWELPIANLYYWIRGLPVPGIAAQKQFDPSHHLTRLIQGNWNIEYARYTSVNSIDLPNKIILTNPDLTVKIIIHSWHF